MLLWLGLYGLSFVLFRFIFRFMNSYPLSFYFRIWFFSSILKSSSILGIALFVLLSLSWNLIFVLWISAALLRRWLRLLIWRQGSTSWLFGWNELRFDLELSLKVYVNLSGFFILIFSNYIFDLFSFSEL